MIRTYFISFHTYGTWLHGSSKGSVDPEHNVYRTPVLPADDSREARGRASMREDPFVMNDDHRRVVLMTIREVCEHRGWQILEINVRTNHVHVVVRASHSPERVMSDLKAWSTRRLREAGLVGPSRTVWSRHGSTRYLWDDRGLTEAIDYVKNWQGEPL